MGKCSPYRPGNKQPVYKVTRPSVRKGFAWDANSAAHRASPDGYLEPGACCGPQQSRGSSINRSDTVSEVQHTKHVTLWAGSMEADIVRTWQSKISANAVAVRCTAGRDIKECIVE